MGLLVLLVRLYEFVLLARVLISWVRVDPYNPVVRFLYQITEPVLDPIRRALPQTMGIDFSPLIALLLIQVLLTVIVSVI
jgi:YggT family protein